MAARRRQHRSGEPARFCSRACGTRGINDIDRRLEATILALLIQLPATATMCPSEAARAVAEPDAWRALMEPARRAARRLAHRGHIDILQRRRIIDAGTFKGPIRLRLRT